jgi:hypothetical protein
MHLAYIAIMFYSLEIQQKKISHFMYVYVSYRYFNAIKSKRIVIAQKSNKTFIEINLAKMFLTFFFSNNIEDYARSIFSSFFANF